MSMKAPILAAVLVAGLATLSGAAFTVDQTKNAMILQFGEIKRVIEEPGLTFKVPMVQNVLFFDKRILTMDTQDPERFITSEKKNVLVDYFVKWRILDPREYYKSVGNEMRARNRLEQTISSGLREEFGKRTVHEVVSGERDKIMEIIREKADLDARRIGVQIVDVRLKRVELPAEVSESVYRRMEAERKRVANELRSEGSAAAEKIRADADRQREVIVAEAYRDAQKIKGEGDAKAIATYAEAFGQNPQFYSFYKSLEAYRSSFTNKGDVMVVDPSSEFFKYLKQSGGSSPKVN